MSAPEKPISSPSRRYAFRTIGFMSAYAAVNAAALFVGFDEIGSTAIAWAFALAVSAPVIAQIWATLTFMRESDEFVRSVVAKQFIMSAGAAMAIASVWGFGESYAAAYHVPAWFIYPLFWACFGVIAPFVKSSN